MKKLLITGFDPFGGASVNPAREAVMALPDVVGDYALTKLEIPTVFGKAAQKVLALEIEIARISVDRATLRDVHKNYNKM